jgi:hypothetical protein
MSVTNSAEVVFASILELAIPDFLRSLRSFQ